MPEAKHIKIAVVGSLNMDYSVMLDKRPVAGETILANDVLITSGGKGANQAYAAGRIGGSVQMNQKKSAAKRPLWRKQRY